jgi:hypothetical protein
MWLAIDTAPYEVDLELAVLDEEGHHALVFPCRRVEAGWQDSDGLPVIIHPTHWRLWTRSSYD